MSFDYDYVPEEDLSAYKVLTEGEGTYKIVEAIEGISKSSGNPMLTIVFQLTDSVGKESLYNLYLVKGDNETAKKATATRVHNLCAGLGRPEWYGKPLVAHNLLGERGKCIIKTQRSDDPKFADKSVISKFIPPSANATVAQNLKDDDIPF